MHIHYRFNLFLSNPYFVVLRLRFKILIEILMLIDKSPNPHHELDRMNLCTANKQYLHPVR